MKIGILGGNGFIGNHLFEHLISNNSTEKFIGSMFDIEKLESFVNDCDLIYHCAGKNREQKGLILSNNLKATGNLVLVISSMNPANRPKVIFLSSHHVYTHRDSEYGISKFTEEQMIMKYLPKWVIWRLPGIYGPGGRPYYNSFVSTLCHSIANNLPYQIHDLSKIIEILFIDELIKILTDEALLSKNRILDISGEKMSLADLEAEIKFPKKESFRITLESYRKIEEK